MSLKNFKLGEKLENYFLLFLDEYIEIKKNIVWNSFFPKIFKIIEFLFSFN